MELSRSLLRLPAGGQVLLSDTTFQRIGGRLHEVKLPDLQLPRARNSVDGPRGSLEGRSRHTFEGQLRQKVEGQSRQNLEGGPGQSSPAGSRRSSTDSTVKLMVSTSPFDCCHCCDHQYDPPHCYSQSFHLLPLS